MTADRGYNHLDPERIRKAKEKSEDSDEKHASTYAQLTPMKEYCKKVHTLREISVIFIWQLKSIPKDRSNLFMPG